MYINLQYYSIYERKTYDIPCLFIYKCACERIYSELKEINAACLVVGLFVV